MRATAAPARSMSTGSGRSRCARRLRPSFSPAYSCRARPTPRPITTRPGNGFCRVFSARPAFPLGVALPYFGTTAPGSAFALRSGQAISRTTYANLFALFGTAYGAGDGSSTFNIPDLRGYMLAGKDDMGGSAANRITNGGSGIIGTTLGATGGLETHTLTTAQLPTVTPAGAGGGTPTRPGSLAQPSPTTNT